MRYSMAEIEKCIETKIIICDVCNGSGKIEESECVDYHHNDYDYWDKMCTRCNGLGRLKETTIVETSILTPKYLKIRERDND